MHQCFVDCCSLVLLDEDGHIRLSDFGLAGLLLEENSPGETQGECGTPGIHTYLCAQLSAVFLLFHFASHFSIVVSVFAMRCTGYIAPEMLRGDVYNTSPDGRLYCLIVAFALFCRLTAFTQYRLMFVTLMVSCIVLLYFLFN